MKRVRTFFVLASLFTLSSAALAQQSAPAADTARSPLLVGTDAIVGSPARTMDGRDIGKVFGLMLDPNDGRVVSVIVTTGGVLGVGASTMAVPWSSMKIGQDQGKVVLTLTQILDNAPKADRGTQSSPSASPPTLPK